MKNLILFILLSTTLFAQKESYIESITIYAEYAELRFGIPKNVSIAVSCYETDFGKKVENHNHFHVLDTDGSVAGYNSSLESFYHFGMLINALPKYKVTHALPMDSRVWCTALHLCGYNSDPKLCEKLHAIIDAL